MYVNLVVIFVVIIFLTCIINFRYDLFLRVIKKFPWISEIFPWIKVKEIIQPLVISLSVTLIILVISLQISGQTDNILHDIKGISQETYSEVKKLSGSGTVESTPIKNKIIKTSLKPDGTITFWVSLNKSDKYLSKGYIFDIGDSYVKSRMSLFVDENGFLTWRIIDNNFIIHSLKYDINQFLNGEQFFTALTWTKEGELKMYINAQPVSEVKLDKLNLNINSTEMYWGSDLDGNYMINFN